MKRKTLTTLLDSFSMLITAQKSNLKNQAILPPRLDSGAFVDAAPFWGGRAKGNFQTFQSHRALLGPTASNTFQLGHSTRTFPTPTCHMCIELKVNRDQNFKVHPYTQSERPEQMQKGVPVLLSLASLTRRQWQKLSQQPAHNGSLLLSKPFPTKQLL